MPITPAVPWKRATSDQPNAASTPTETSVSMVVLPCRRFSRAARWNGHAPQTTTGAARVSDSHCQPSTWSAGTIAISTTGRLSSAEASSRWRSPSSSGSRSSGSPAAGSVAGRLAAYPAAATVARSSSVETVAACVTRARSVA